MSKRILKSGLLIIVAVVAPQPALTADSEGETTRTRRSVSNYEAYRTDQGKSHASLGTLQSELSRRVYDVNRAIKMGRRAVETDPEDVDARIALGEALYEKIKASKKDDPATFNECVKTWLLVYRNLIGAERGMTIKGIGIPGMRNVYQDEDHGGLAKQRLITLCGRTPKVWETNKKFLDKVLQAETAVSGAVVKKSRSNNEDR